LAFTYTVTGSKQLGEGTCKLIYGTWDATGVTDGVIVFGGSKNPPTVALTTTTAASTTLTTSGSYTTSDVQEGDAVTGTGIVGGTTVASVESATSLTLTTAATDSSAASRTFTRISRGAKTHNPITARVVSSVSSTTMTGSRLIGKSDAIGLVCVSGDAGYWSVVVA